LGLFINLKVAARHRFNFMSIRGRALILRMLSHHCGRLAEATIWLDHKSLFFLIGPVIRASLSVREFVDLLMKLDYCPATSKNDLAGLLEPGGSPTNYYNPAFD
jgi:hypothetical protein